ncbi:substrate-binding periplasmic protein [Roseibium sp.]|uniref:substrate-binding periplasmic protein n=1 Tax=Roseibium sp. TaxID=1936156 RepID=UPI003D0EF7FF
MISTIENSPLTRIAELIMTEAYGRLGIPVEIYSTSGNRSLVVSSSGKVDGELARIGAVKDLYPTLVQVPVPNMELKGIVYVRADEKDRITSGNLTKLRVGYLEGVVQAEQFTQGIESVWAGQSEEELFRLLAAGRLDAVVSDQIDGALAIAGLGLTNVVPLGRPFQVEPMFHYLHEKHANLVPQLATVLAKMRGDGELDRIVETAMDAMIAGQRIQNAE